MAESAYDDLSRRLNYQVPKPIPLLFYVSHAEFEQNDLPGSEAQSGEQQQHGPVAAAGAAPGTPCSTAPG